MPSVTKATKGNASTQQAGMFFWDLELDDGSTPWGLFKHDIEVGEEVVVTEQNGKLRARRPQKDQQAPSNGSSASSSGDVRDDPVQILIVRQSSIKAAVEMNTGMVAGMDDSRVQEKIDEWIDYFERKTWEAVSGEPGESSKVIAAPTAEAGATSGSPDTEAQGPTTAVEVREHLQGLGIDHDLVKMKLSTFNAERLDDLSTAQLLAVANWAEEAKAHDERIPF